MPLYKTIATPEGGKHVEMTPEEEAVVLAEWAEAEKQREENAWLHGRKQAYPSIHDQLDMMYHDRMSGTSIWSNTITEIKKQFPKP
jgi:hypothetical protein